jgi:hypothetical protein
VRTYYDAHFRAFPGRWSLKRYLKDALLPSLILLLFGVCKTDIFHEDVETELDECCCAVLYVALAFSWLDKLGQGRKKSRM